MDQAAKKMVLSPPPEILTGWGIDSEKLYSELSRSASVVNVSSWSAVKGLNPPEGARIVIFGRAEVIPGLKAKQKAVDFESWSPWMAGDPTDKALVLIRAALAEVSLGPDAHFTRITPEQAILVWGRGRSAIRTTIELINAGRKVFLVGTPEDELPQTISSGLSAVFPTARLQDFSGFPGRFSAILSNNGGTEKLPVGAAILCGFESVKDAGSDAGKMSLGDFEKAMLENQDPDWASDPHFKLAFTAGLQKAVSTRDMGRIMSAALKSAESVEGPVFILAPHVKTAGPGLERLYSQAREAGVVFLRPPDNGPDMETLADGRTRFTFFDGAARAEISLTADLLVEDEFNKPGPETAEAAEVLDLMLGSDGYIAPDNVLFLSSAANRRGVMALGPARGTYADDIMDREIASAVLEAVNITAPVEMRDNLLLNDAGRCAICLTCVRACPFNALDYTYRPTPDPLACVECGLCTAECPGDALQMDGCTDAQVRAGLKILLQRPRQDGVPRLVMFGCRRSAFPSLASAPRPEAAIDLTPIPLPCAGKIEEDLVLTALLQGADGVMIAACHHDNCRTHKGSIEAHRKFRRLSMLLEKSGFDTARLSFVTLAPNMGVELKNAVLDLNRRIKALGTSSQSGGLA